MKILSYDVETTSPEPATCRVVQVAAILFEPETEKGYEHLTRLTSIMNEIVDPGMASSDGATAIHGIGPEQWAGKRPDSEAMVELHNYIQENYQSDGQPQFIVAGHNVNWFDLPILWRLSERPPIFGLPVIDTMLCAQRLYPLAPSHRLTTNAAEPDKIGLTEWLGLPLGKAHDAAGDAVMVHALVNHFCKGLNKTPMELAVWCAEPRLLKFAHFGKHKGKLWGKGEGCVPTGYAWFIAKNFDPSPDLAVTLKYHYNMSFTKPMRA